MLRDLSFWEKAFITDNVQYCIIGAGIVGLCTAYFLKLKYPDARIIILERSYPGKGASTKNAGFACFGSASEILSDISSMGEDKTVRLIEERWNGLKRLKELVSPKIMDYKNYGATEFFFKENIQKCEFVLDNLSYLNGIVESASSIKSCFQINENKNFYNFASQSIFNPHEGQLNPMLMIEELKRKILNMGVSIIYSAEVINIDAKKNNLFLAGNLEIGYNKLIVCTNGFAVRLYPKLVDLMAVRNQVVITEEIQNLKLKGTYHMDEGFIYFRNYQNRILLGGARNIDEQKETTDLLSENDFILNYLKRFLHKHLEIKNSVRIAHKWSGILGVGSSKTPIIKEIEKDVFVAVRLGGMGVAIGSQVAKKIVGLID